MIIEKFIELINAEIKKTEYLILHTNHIEDFASLKYHKGRIHGLTDSLSLFEKWYKDTPT